MNKTFSIVKKGYDPLEVDRYITELEEIVKSYKEKDVAIKNALVNAQIAADNIVKNAEVEADTYKLKSIEKLFSIKNSIGQQRNQLANFKNDYNRLIQRYVKDFNDFDFISVENRIDELHDYIDDVISDKNIEDFQDTKIVKSVKDYGDKNLINRNETLKIDNSNNNQPFGENISSETKAQLEKNFQDMFSEETPIEPINLIDSNR